MNRKLTRFMKSKIASNTMCLALNLMFPFAVLYYLSMMMFSAATHYADARTSDSLALIGWSHHRENPEIAREILNSSKYYGSFTPYIMLEAIETKEHLAGRNISEMSLSEISDMDFTWRDRSILSAISNLDDLALGKYLSTHRQKFDPESNYNMRPASEIEASHAFFHARTNFSENTLKDIKTCYERVRTEMWIYYELATVEKGSCVDLFFEDKKTQKEDLFLIKSKGNKLS